LPRRTHPSTRWVAPGLTAVGIVGRASQEALSAMIGEVWGWDPFLWLAGIAFVFFLGQTYADWTNDRSWLQQWWFNRIALFDLILVVPASVVEDGAEVFKVRAKMRFRKAHKASESAMFVYLYTTDARDRIEFDN